MIIDDALNMAYSYAATICQDSELCKVSQEFNGLAGETERTYITKSTTITSYSDIQNLLSKLNEKESVRKSKMSGRPDRSDSHQLLAYVLLTGVQRCGFILPGNKTEVREMITSQDNYLPLAPRLLRYYELLLGSNSDSKELRKVLQ